jgi:tight adherence protein B
MITSLFILVGMCALALGAVVYLALAPKPAQVSLSRRRPGVVQGAGGVTRMTQSASRMVGRLLGKRGSTAGTATALELAGITMRVQDFILMLFGFTLAGGVLGVLLFGSIFGCLLALLAPIAVKFVLGIRTSRRQAKFAEQLHDALQMMSGNLRAGHSLLQTLDSVAHQAPAPLSGEFIRVVNETRVGRDVGQALEETAVRMNSKDMRWIAQAIVINQQTGGNLAEVLDQVSGTIRERSQIRRQVSSLSAEGKLSAIILMLLPFVVFGAVLTTNPSYMAKFTQSLLGYALLAAALVLLVLGGVWLRKVTTIKF